MALRFLESFDHIGTNGLLLGRKWDFHVAAIIAGRTAGGQAAQMSGGSGILGKLFTNGTTLVAGFALFTNDFDGQIFRFNPNGGDGSFGLNIVHVGDGRVQATMNVFDGSGAAPPSVFSFNLNQWYYCEFQGTVTNVNVPAGTVTCSFDFHVNGVSVSAGTFTAQGAAGHVSAAIGLAVWNPGNTATVDDIYVTDSEFLGDIRNMALFRAADGDSLAWTPNIAGAHYLMVNQDPPDDDTTTLASSTAGQEDMGTMTQITGVTGTIKGIQGVWDGSVTGSDVVQGGYKSGGVTVLAANQFPVANWTIYSLDPRRESPFTGVDWTISEINAMQLDVKKVA